MQSTEPSESERAALEVVLTAHGLRAAGPAERVSAGTLNRNFRVPIEDGAVFARCYRPELPAERIRHEHAITRWVADRGIPAIAPRSLAGGETVIEVGAERWSLFPWVLGRMPVRGAITASEAESIGAIHGRTQQALAEHPGSPGASWATLSGEIAWDTARSLAVLREIEARASADRTPRVPWAVLEALRFQRKLLESGAARPIDSIGELPCQLLHGDFHDQQVLLGAEDAVVAVVDWELTRAAARIWELVRALSFSQVLETDLLAHYLRGFRRHVTLSEEECRDGIELWWQTRLHGTWVYAAYFLEGNQRVAPFLEETDRHLRRFADERWRRAIADRLILGSRPDGA